MNILILSSYYPPDVAATGVVVSQVAGELAKRGHRVSILTSMPHYDRNRIWPEYRGKMSVTDTQDGISVRRLYTYVPSNKSSFSGRAMGYACFTGLAGVFGLVSGRSDLVLAISPPLTIGLSADLISRTTGVPFVYNVQDVWPDVVVRAGQLSNPRLVQMFSRMERYIYSRAASVTVLSNQMKENLLQKGVPVEKLNVIPTCQDVQFVTFVSKDNAFALENGLNERFVVLFAGNMGHSQGLETVLNAAKRLEARPEILFVMVGNGVARPGLERYAEKLKLDNVVILPYQPHERIPEVYGAADVCLVPLRKGFTTESVPSKVHTIMAAQKPLVASVDTGSATDELIRTARCGICVELENSAGLAEAIVRLFEDDALRKVLGQNGRAFIEDHFTPEVVADQYEDLLEGILSEKRSD